MKLPVWVVNAFTRAPFGGNPAAVVVLEEWLPDATLQGIAAQMNLAETAFFVADSELTLRWFTPALEVPLCGHATLATGRVLQLRGRMPRAGQAFTTKSGVIAVEAEGDRLTLDFPAGAVERVEDVAPYATALGVAPLEVYVGKYAVVVLEDAATVEGFEPRFERIAALSEHVSITAPGGDGVDFVSRFFAPRAGIPEDPVTGSSHCLLAPFWAQRLGRTSLRAVQVSPRRGELSCELRGDRVRMTGDSRVVLEGTLEI